MDIAARLLNALLMIAVPIVLGVFIARRYRVRWRLFLFGGLTFIASQILHIPFNQFVLIPWLDSLGIEAQQGQGLILFALALGLSAGVFEETARYISYRTAAKDARTWDQALMFGTGHGGVEAILLGALALIAFVQIMALQGTDLATVIPEGQVGQAQAQIEAYWSLPWYGALMGAVERVFALSLHLFLSLFVLQALLEKRLSLFLGAILWHMIVDALAVYGLAVWGVYWAEVLIGVMGLLSLAGVYLLSKRMPRFEVARSHPVAQERNELESSGVSGPPSSERVEDSRFYDGE